MQIGELARLTGCAVDTIRYYEKQSLLPPPARSAGNFRDYADSHVERLRLIRHCRALDMSLDEIRSLLRLESDRTLSCGEIDAIAREHLADVRSKLRELNRIARELGTPTLHVANARGLSVDALLKNIAVAERLYAQHQCPLLAMLVNRVDPTLLAEAEAALHAAREGPELGILLLPEREVF